MSRSARLAVSAAIAVVALTAILLAREIPSRHVRGDPGPRALPIGAAAVILVGAAAALADDARRSPVRRAPADPVGHSLPVAAATAAYLVLMPVVGFGPATAFFVTGTSLWLDRPRRHPVLAHLLVGAGAAGVLWVAFGRLLDVALPQGPLGI
ncbi:MAG: tripartite tricarboxylate transporter TctB family protein [Armatimonadota bacterium]|nr:tripartite tricarboxylate transporter TctB family protein [Armatimonadota bacterium]MDR7518983.1 tripartite tricarboxylate transporter TctB family protein [Armatimonadota bacterium]MDR7548898.1 tripartite tricarboxylate transporter TctB family protein [Armatimonadota bacterium]